MDKVVITAGELLRDSFRLGMDIVESGFEPTLIIAIWRGGTPVGMAVQELLAYCGIDADHIAIRTSSYRGVDERSAVTVHGLQYMIDKVSHSDRLLIVDDVFDTGNTFVAVLDELRKRAKANTPADIRLAAPWFKPSRNETNLTPDFCLHETDDWLVFPHELDAFTAEEMRELRPAVAAVVHGGDTVDVS